MKLIKVTKDFSRVFGLNNYMNGKAFTEMGTLGDQICYFNFV